MKYLKYIIGSFLAGLVLSYGLSVTAATLQGFQGGTGISTTTAGNVGNVLQVASTSPFLTWTIGSAGAGTLSGNGTSTQVPYYTGLQTLSSSPSFTFDPATGNITVIGTSTIGTLKFASFSATPQIYADSDTNTGIAFVGPDIIYLLSGGSPALVVDSTGRIGIATTTPSTKLYVNGSSTVSGNAYFLSKVGIGTTTPTNTLSVNGTFDAGTSTMTHVYVQQHIHLSSSSQPTVDTDGSLIIHDFVYNGIPRFEADSPYTLFGCDAISQDNCEIVKNTSGGSITLGQAVYVNGGVGANPTISLAQANTTSTANLLALVATSSASNNAFLLVMKSGVLHDVNTSAWSAGDPLYLSGTVAGGLTNVRPTYPYLVTRVGTVMVSSVNNGVISVNVAPAVLGQETGTISSTFNIGGSNALTTSTGQLAISFPIPIASTSLSVAATSALAINGNVLYNNGVTSTVAGTNITQTTNGGTNTINTTTTPSFTSVTYSGDSTKQSTAYTTSAFNVINSSTTVASGASSTIQKLYFIPTTLSLVYCSTDGATVTLQSDYRTSSTPQTYGTSTFSGLACSSTGTSTATFTNANIPANSILNFWISSVANSTTTLRVTYKTKEQ